MNKKEKFRIGSMILVVLIFSLFAQVALAQQNNDINNSFQESGVLKTFTAYQKPPTTVQINFLDKPPELTPEQEKKLKDGLKRTHLPGPIIQIKKTPVGPLQPQTNITDNQSLETINVPETFTIFKNVIPTTIGAITPDEPSTASKGRYVFYTGNFYTALSTNGGSTFRYISPSIDMPRFCCDQDVIYDNNRDLFIWYRQGRRDANSENFFRLGVSSNGSVWRFYDIYPTNISRDWNNQWWDYPQLALSNNYLYITSNMFGTGENNFTRSVVMRISINDLKKGTGFNFNYYAENRFTFTPVHGARSTAYWGTHGFANFNFILFSWDENSPNSGIYWYSYFIDPWNPIIRDTIFAAYCPGPDGNNWCSRADSRVMTGYLANGIIGFFWMANPSFPAKYPYIRGVQFKESDKSRIGQPQIWSDLYAMMYPAVSPNARGDLGMSLFLGGGKSYPSHVVGIEDEFSPSWTFVTARVGTNGDAIWGDYIRTRPYYSTGNFKIITKNVWSATGYTLQGNRIEPRYTIFGRERDMPNNPPENLNQLKSNSLTVIPFGGQTDETTIMVRASVYSIITGDSYRLEVEMKPIEVGFTGVPNCISPVTSGNTTNVTCSNLTDSQYYHWQTRANYTRGAYSDWISFGSIYEYEPDFIITSINKCTKISMPATYNIKKNIINSTVDKCITITSSNVTLEGANHIIDGIDTSNSYGIYAYNSRKALTNVIVKNLKITDWNYGIYYKSISKGNIINNNAISNYYGFYLDPSSGNNKLTSNKVNFSNNYGFYIGSGNNTLDGNNASSSSNGYAFYLSYQSKGNNLRNNNVVSNDGIGLYIDSSSDNNLTKNNVSTNSGFGIGFGIYISHSRNNTLRNNTINSNTFGIYLTSSDNNTLTGNVAKANTFGIYIRYSRDNDIRYNIINNSTTNGLYFDGRDSYYNKIKNNTVNGDFYYHLVNENNIVLKNLILNAPKVSNLGKISVINSTNVTIRDMILSNNSMYGNSGLYLYKVNKSFILNITTNSNYYGTRLESSTNNTLNRNNANSNIYDILLHGYGFYLDPSSGNNKLTNNKANFSNSYGFYIESGNNILDGNNASSNGDGFFLSYQSNNNTLKNNNAVSNSYGFYTDSIYNTYNRNNATLNSYGFYLSSYSKKNNLTNNNVSYNKADGIYISSSNNNNLIGNTVNTNQNLGISMWAGSSNNTLKNNNISYNKNYGIYLSQSGNNTIFNNFFNNTNNLLNIISGNKWNITKTSGKNIVGGPYIGGNFWANPMGTGFSQLCADSNSDGICDSLYLLDSNNRDYLPLAKK